METECDAEVERRRIVTSSMEDLEKSGCCRARMIEYHDYRTLMGPCLISFSIPLLIPGVVLTVVGSYGNEHTFPTFGGWHISGIVILIIAVSLLLLGIVFKCAYKPYLTPDVTQHLTPRQSIVSGHQNLGFESERDSETARRVYKGTDKHDLNTQINNQLHRVVSTHEVRERVPVSAIEANGDIAQVQDEQRNTSNRHKQTNKVSHKDSFKGRDDDLIEEAQEHVETEHREKRKKKRRPKRSVTTEETSCDGITTTVTSSVHAKADTQVVTLSDQERNPSSQFPTEKKRRHRKKKKKKRHLEKKIDDATATLSDSEPRTELPELHTRTSQLPPHVPHHFDTEVDINTPFPIQETRHIPFHLKTDRDFSESNENYELSGIPKRFDLDFHNPSSSELSEDLHRQEVQNLEQTREYSHPSILSHKRDLDLGDSNMAQDSNVSLFRHNSDLTGQRERQAHKSHHAHFLKKRGIDTQQQCFGRIEPELDTDFDLETGLPIEHSHHVHFRNKIDSDLDIPRTIPPYPLNSADEDDDNQDKERPSSSFKPNFVNSSPITRESDDPHVRSDTD